MNTITIKSEDIDGTLLGEIFQITKEDIEKARTTLAKDAIIESDKLAGVMNDLEQKIYALLVKKVQQAKETVEKMVVDGDFQKIEASGDDISLLKDLLFSHQLRKRLKLEKKSTGIRAGFQVVYLGEVEHEDCSECAARELCPIAH